MKDLQDGNVSGANCFAVVGPEAELMAWRECAEGAGISVRINGEIRGIGEGGVALDVEHIEPLDKLPVALGEAVLFVGSKRPIYSERAARELVCRFAARLGCSTSVFQFETITSRWIRVSK